MVDYDKPGHCIVHGEPLFEERAVNGELRRVPKPYMAHTSFLLNDDSIMRVIMCRKAKKALKNDSKTFKAIMDKVYKGWEVETKQLVKDHKKKDWDEKKAEEYLKGYKKKEIVDRIDDLPIRSLEGIDREIAKVKRNMIRKERERLSKKGKK